MKMPSIFLLLSSCLLSCFSFAQSADEKAVAERVESLRKAMISPDRQALQGLTADQLSFGHSTGLVEDKSLFVDDLIKGKFVFKTINISDQTISISGNAAIVRNRFTAETFNNNTPAKVDIITLMIWQKQNGIWKLLARQGVRISKPD
ncbi:MAG TPA: nuclear transport factor 2 family protein [Puia sp.]